ncbi:MAG: hypothetical protein GF349_04275 [Candidatus Magasanikbacteria bacterium]|nr:hypothetical protein [Candidatus Magasanikbacteria bacterium]
MWRLLGSFIFAFFLVMLAGESHEVEASEVADYFSYPVLGNSRDLSIDPRNDGWTTLGICEFGAQYCNGTSKYHPGEDFFYRCFRDDGSINRDCAYGEPVYATANGLVTFSGVYKDGSWGKAVVILHTLPSPVDISEYIFPGTTMPAGESAERLQLETGCIHLFKTEVVIGQEVKRGDLIGYIGIGYGGYAHAHCEGRWLLGKPDFPEYAGSVQGLTNRGLFDLSDFIADRSAPTHFVYDPGRYDSVSEKVQNPKTCSNEPTHDDAWWYTCNEQDTFIVGDTLWGLFRIDNIQGKHTFKVVARHNGNYSWEWSYGNTNPSYVWPWDYGFFSFRHEYLPLGTWDYDLYVDTGDGFPDYPVATATAEVVLPDDVYTYDGNGYTCANEPHLQPGREDEWWYTCGEQTEFAAGDTIWGLFRIDDVYRNHQFRVDTYRNGVFQWNWSPDWGYVDPLWPWDHAFFWFYLSNATFGDWEFKVSVNTGGGFFTIGSAYFTVGNQTEYYRYDDNAVACRDPVTGDANTAWWFSCDEPSYYYWLGENINLLLRIDNVVVSHRFRVKIYHENQLQSVWTGDWNTVNPLYPWNYAFYFPVHERVPGRGNWFYVIEIDVDDGLDFQYLDTIPINVL